MEIWKDIPSFGWHYQASNLGNIRSKDRIVKKFSIFGNRIVGQFYEGRLLKPHNSKGYKIVRLGYEKQKITVGVHRLVLMAFVGDCPEGMECCHNNGISDDNRIENLRWDTHKNNNKDRKRHGTYKTGKEHPMYGKKMSLDLKERLLKFHKGRKASEETKAKMTASQKARWEKIRVSKQTIT
jgi:hypothetical protein